MKLREYLDKNDITCERFAASCGCSGQTIVAAAKGYEISLTLAIKIEEVTHGAVKCIDLRPTKKRIVANALKRDVSSSR